ncbi:MAG: DUF6036 family nucleotidyltransferase [Gemmatimonadaceae bacterium]
MTREQLEHAIRAVCDVSGETEIIVIGSQAILGEFPHAPPFLRQSTEVDVILKNKPEMTDRVEGALGEFSSFHGTHDFYVHGVTPETATLPAGWEARLVMVRSESTRQNTGWCLQGYDLAASKLVAFRDKDRDFVRVLLAEGLLVPSTLQERVEALPIEEARRTQLIDWVRQTAVAFGVL